MRLYRVSSIMGNMSSLPKHTIETPSVIVSTTFMLSTYSMFAIKV